MVAQQFAISVGRFLRFAEFLEALAAGDISFRDPGQEFLVADVDALEIGVRLRPSAALGGNLA